MPGIAESQTHLLHPAAVGLDNRCRRADDKELRRELNKLPWACWWRRFGKYFGDGILDKIKVTVMLRSVVAHSCPKKRPSHRGPNDYRASSDSRDSPGERRVHSARSPHRYSQLVWKCELRDDCITYVSKCHRRVLQAPADTWKVRRIDKHHFRRRVCCSSFTNVQSARFDAEYISRCVKWPCEYSC